MKKIKLMSCILFGVIITTGMRTKESAKDCSPLTLAQLINVSQNDLANADDVLEGAGYRFATADIFSKEAAYNCIDNNTYVVRYWPTSKTVEYHIQDYSDEMKKTYLAEIKSLNLTKGSSVTGEGYIETPFTPAAGGYKIIFRKIATESGKKHSVQIIVSP